MLSAAKEFPNVLSLSCLKPFRSPVLPQQKPHFDTVLSDFCTPVVHDTSSDPRAREVSPGTPPGLPPSAPIDHFRRECPMPRACDPRVVYLRSVSHSPGDEGSVANLAAHYDLPRIAVQRNDVRDQATQLQRDVSLSPPLDEPLWFLLDVLQHVLSNSPRVTYSQITDWLSQLRDLCLLADKLQCDWRLSPRRASDTEPSSSD